MYNTKFQVKYNDIEDELTHKLKDKTPQEYDENSDEEYEYSSQDVIDICDKLYRDELLSVFGADDITDHKIEQGFKYVFDIIITNIKFKDIIDELTQISLEQFLKNETINEDKSEGLRQLILCTLFSKHVFYITHKCVCQQIETGIIDDTLLVELRNHTVDLIKNHFT